MRILVVEDEELLAAAVADGLTAEGFDVDVSHDGNDGLWRAGEGSSGPLALDLLLPRHPGHKAGRGPRGQRTWAPHPILPPQDGEHAEAEGPPTRAAAL